MKKVIKQTYNVTCPSCKRQKIPVVVEIEEGSENKVTSSVDLLCPTCGNSVRANIDGKLSENSEAYKLFRNP